MKLYSLGLDFGTESVRALVCDITNGDVVAIALCSYEHGVIDRALPTGGGALPTDYAFQHPLDWLSAAAKASREAMATARLSPEQVIGVGVAFTSCTMMPALADGTPLCLAPGFEQVPMAWPKLWKHHGAKDATDRINEVARERSEPWLARYGNTIGIEWFFPKILETLQEAPTVYERVEVWLEAGDWFVWQLVDGPFPNCSPTKLTRSTCQAGYKACWNAQTGYPSRDYFAAVDPKMAGVVSEKMPGTLRAPGTVAGSLSPAIATLFGLHAGTPVSAAIIDAHAGVPGAGVAEADTLVMVMGTSSCHMLNSRREALASGIAGVVADGILPGYFGYETGQSGVGDVFNWVTTTLRGDHQKLNQLAAKLPPGSNGLLAIDWLNGCRTPLMDGRLSGALVGLTLSTQPEEIYRAMMEATAFGVRWIRDTLRDAGIPVRKFVASGGLPAKSPLLVQIYADVIGERIEQAGGDQPVALGAAMLGAVAAGKTVTGHASVADAIHAMAPKAPARIFTPDATAVARYSNLYDLYRVLTLADGPLAQSMRALRGATPAPSAEALATVAT